jgi:hypothetical protein
MSHIVTAEFDDFGFGQIQDAARRQGVPVETLLVHAAMYYLADLESGRMAAKVLPHDADGTSAPLRRSAED